MRRHSEQLGAVLVVAAEHQRSTNVALVPEQVLLEHRQRGHNAGARTGIQLVQLHIARDELGDELCVRRRARTAAPDAFGNVVDLFAVLVCYNRAFRRTGICSKDDAALVDQADDCRTRTRRTRHRTPMGRDVCIARVCAKVKATPLLAVGSSHGSQFWETRVDHV